MVPISIKTKCCISLSWIRSSAEIAHDKLQTACLWPAGHFSMLALQANMVIWYGVSLPDDPEVLCKLHKCKNLIHLCCWNDTISRAPELPSDRQISAVRRRLRAIDHSSGDLGAWFMPPSFMMGQRGGSTRSKAHLHLPVHRHCSLLLPLEKKRGQMRSSL